MALTSKTAQIINNTLIFDVHCKGYSRGQGVIAYVDYESGPGDATKLKIYLSFNDSRIDDLYYRQIVVNKNVLELCYCEISTDGQYRYPLAVASNEDRFKVEIYGLVDGNLNIDFVIDNPYQ